MNDFLLYLLKVSAGIGIIYLVYLTIFSKDTFYLRNRILLILALLLPPVFPLLKIPVQATSAVEKIPVESIDSSVISNSIGTISGAGNAFDYNRLVIWVYFIISALLLLRIIVSLVSTYRIIRKGKIVHNQFPKVVVSDVALPPFSFFPFVVIPSDDYRNKDYSDILNHEYAHITQGHTFDLLLSELFIAFQWYNPFVWFIKRSIVLNHEYLADHISLRNNKSVLEYQYRLLNFQSGLKHVSLAHNFNSLIKNRIIMINKKRSRKYAALKNILILPVVAIVVYAFATPDYKYSDKVQNDNTILISQPSTITQKEVRGVVVSKDGKPIEGVDIIISEMGKATVVRTDKEGRFSIINIQEDATLLLSARGYKNLSVKPDFKQEMRVKLELDPEYKELSVEPKDTAPKPLVVIDRVVTDLTPEALFSKMGAEIATVKNLQGKEAMDKYGEGGRNGVFEAYTVKGAKEFGIVVPFMRRTPDDFPTFRGERPYRFTYWIIDNMQYPAEAASSGIQGRITVKFTVEADGSVDKIVPVGKANQILSDAVVKAIQASPKWEPAKNPEAREPFEHLVTLKFGMPGKILNNGEAFVVVEEMPMYPGGEAELMKFLAINTTYPEAARNEKIQGKVIVRFIVGASGDAEEAVVLKGVHPLLDEEAVRVVSMLKGFIPGKQGGQAVDVYYMVPVTFSLPTAELSK